MSSKKKACIFGLGNQHCCSGSINNIFLHVQDELDSSYYYEIKVLELEFLDKHRDVNQLDEKLYMVREINELSFDEINNRISVNP